MKGRCGWADGGDPLYAAYHDEEWGVPERDSRALYEKLVLDGFRAAFADFDPKKIARFNEKKIDALLQDAGIIRSRAKIEAAVNGARIYLEMEARGEDFSEFLWGFVDGKPIQNSWKIYREAPAKTELSETIAKELKRRGFKFCGPVIVYAFMQAVGMVNDHQMACPRRAACAKLARVR
jgi:DNA-3-methyladenine glycosylase I